MAALTDFGSPLRRRLRRILATTRTTLPARALARAARIYLDRYENLNYDPWNNGERDVLDRLGGRDARRIFDVGASRGDWARIALHSAPQARIDCFEIVPETAAVLARALADDARAAVHAFGLGDEAREVDVSVPSDVEHATITAYRTGRTVRGRLAVGDSFVEENAIDHIDLLKIDVEGAEDRVLRGFARTFARRAIDVVQFEYGLPNIVTHFLLRDFHAFFEERGFVVGKIFPGRVEFRQYRYEDEDFRGPNYLAVRRDRDDLISALGQR